MKAKRKGQPWTREDLRLMRHMARSRVSAREAAPLLDRTVGSVKWCAMVRGIHFRAIAQKPGTQRTRAQRERLRQVQLRRWRAQKQRRATRRR